MPNKQLVITYIVGKYLYIYKSNFSSSSYRVNSFDRAYYIDLIVLKLSLNYIITYRMNK